MATQTADLARVDTPRRGATRQWRKLREMSLGYALLAPALLLLLVFEFYPVFYGLYISSCDWRLTCTRFIGLDNFTRAFQDPELSHSLWTAAGHSLSSV